MAIQGRQPSAVSGTDSLRAAAASQGGDATIAPQGLTFGKMTDGSFAGKMAAQYRKVAGTAATTYNITHGLGFVPAWCILLGCDEPFGTPTILSSNWFEWGKWTATEVRVRIKADLGNQSGAAMWFLIGGQR